MPSQSIDPRDVLLGSDLSEGLRRVIHHGPNLRTFIAGAKRTHAHALFAVRKVDGVEVTDDALVLHLARGYQPMLPYIRRAVAAILRDNEYVPVRLVTYYGGRLIEAWAAPRQLGS